MTCEAPFEVTVGEISSSSYCPRKLCQLVAKEKCCFDALMSSYLVGTKHPIYKLRL
jgi:hypothetical protein